MYRREHSTQEQPEKGVELAKDIFFKQMNLHQET